MPTPSSFGPLVYLILLCWPLGKFARRSIGAKQANGGLSSLDHFLLVVAAAAAAAAAAAVLGAKRDNKPRGTDGSQDYNDHHNQLEAADFFCFVFFSHFTKMLANKSKAQGTKRTNFGLISFCCPFSFGL